ncbi:MAG: hypothetical protein R2708_14545 [Vicinamibacterales bacterium]
MTKNVFDSSRNWAAFRAPPSTSSLAKSRLNSCASGAWATRPLPTPSSLISLCRGEDHAVVQRPHRVVGRGQRLVAIQLASGRHQVQALSRVCLALMVTNITCTTWSSGSRSKMMAATRLSDSSWKLSMSACSASRRCWPSMTQDAFALGHLQRAERTAKRPPRTTISSHEMMTAPSRRQVACLAALLVCWDELVDLLADDLALVGLLARRDPAFEEVPADLGRRFLPPAHPGGRMVTVAEHLEAHQLVDVTGRQGGLVELHSELLHPNRGDADHRGPLDGRILPSVPGFTNGFLVRLTGDRTSRRHGTIPATV